MSTRRECRSNGIGQPYLSSGGGPFGTFVRGGGALLFGDMLGERRMGAAVQIGNRLRDAAFDVSIPESGTALELGRDRRARAQRIRRYRRTERSSTTEKPRCCKQADYLQRMQLRAAALVAYPFSRGLRIEFTGGVRHATYHRDLRSQISSADTGRVLATDQVEIRGRRADDGGRGRRGARARHDGLRSDRCRCSASRYRFEVAPAVGASLIHARRRRLPPVRHAGASVFNRVRVLHSARYGAGRQRPAPAVELPRFELFRARSSPGRFATASPTPTRVCGDELLGNRLLVGNVEVRFPLWGILSRQIDYGPFPADAFRVCRWRHGVVGISQVHDHQQLWRRHSNERGRPARGDRRHSRARRSVHRGGTSTSGSESGSRSRVQGSKFKVQGSLGSGTSEPSEP